MKSIYPIRDLCREPFSASEKTQIVNLLLFVERIGQTPINISGHTSGDSLARPHRNLNYPLPADIRAVQVEAWRLSPFQKKEIQAEAIRGNGKMA